MNLAKIKEPKFTASERMKIEKYIREIDKNIAKEEMTPLERYLAVEHHKMPDRVPVRLSSMEHNSRSISCTIKEVLKNPKKAIMADLATVTRYGCDNVIPYADPHIIGTEEIGAKIRYPEDGTAIFVESPVKTIKDVEKLEVPDPYADGKLPMVLEVIEYLKTSIGDKIHLQQHLNGPFGYAGDLRGPRNLLMDMITNPNLVHALMEFCTEAAITISRAVQKAGANTFPFDAMAAPEYVGKKRYKEFIYPYQKKVVDALSPPGSYFCIDGNVRDIIKEYSSMGAKGIYIESFKNLDELKKIKEEAGGKTALIVLTVRAPELLHGPLNKIETLVKDVIKTCAPGGGLIVGAGVVPIEAPFNNVNRFVVAVKKYGKYPLNL